MNIFGLYAHFCAAYSSEVIIFFLTTFVGSITLNSKNFLRICNWSINNCTNETQDNENQGYGNGDAILLSILRCSTIIYLFIKLKTISKQGSRHIMLSVLFCVITATIIFSAIVRVMLGEDWAIVGGALPIFLMLIDLSRIVALVKHTLSSISNNDIHDKIAEAMKILGPVYTVDTILEMLVIFTSNYVNIRQVNELSCYAILSLCINFVIFTTFVPACLSTYLAVTKSKLFGKSSSGLPIWHKSDFFHSLEDNNKKNPYTFRMKILTCVVLIMFNVLRGVLYPKFIESSFQSSFDSVFDLSPQQMFTLTILMLLGMKLILKIDKLQSESEENITDMKTNEMAPRTNIIPQIELSDEAYVTTSEPERSIEICVQLSKTGCSNLLSDGEILTLLKCRKIVKYNLETVLHDPNRGVDIRRKLLLQELECDEQKHAVHQIPHTSYNFSKATKACCENTIGYIPVPVGIAGPLLMNGESYQVPLATTEGTLLASTNRGMKALYLSGGVKTQVYRDGMTRSPVVKFSTSEECCNAFKWIEDPYNFEVLKDSFDGTSRFAKLVSIHCNVSGRLLYIRFKAFTGDAMGMNMVSKGAECALKILHKKFPNMHVISLSGNYCTDKKPSAVNWIMGRGKSVIAEAVIPGSVVNKVLKTSVDALVQTSFYKNQIGSAMAGSIGGNNAHAANIVTALFIATGQDPAQNVESSNCITMLEKEIAENAHGELDEYLVITCTMPSIEVATIGGGTILDPQSAALKLLNLSRENTDKPGDKSSLLAQIVCASVVAGELSLLSALSAGHLVASHMKHNRIQHSSNIPVPNSHNIL